MLKSRTSSVITHRTTLTNGDQSKDGGRQFLLDVFDLIHREKQVGTLTVNFGLGGSVSGVTFEERRAIAQSDLIQ